jgi:hypothetical protein
MNYVGIIIYIKIINFIIVGPSKNFLGLFTSKLNQLKSLCNFKRCDTI